jgi:hypothetical protein
MIVLTVFDSRGEELHIGDTVMVTSKYIANRVFYTTFDIVDGCLFPQDIFSSPVITKSDIPEEAKECALCNEGNRPTIYVVEAEANHKDELMPSLQLLTLTHNKSFKLHSNA